jgi:tellurite resistance protein TerC
MPNDSIGSPIFWAGFIAFILAMLVLDLGVLHRRAHTVSFREALLGCAMWVSLGLAFNLWIYLRYGTDKAVEFLTGYVIEYALSVDNIFVFLVIFAYFSVSSQHQHRVLFWGILGAIVLRATFVLLGSALIHRFAWVLYVFGAFLVFTGIKLVVAKHSEVHPERNPVLRLFRKLVPIHSNYDGQKFFITVNGRRLATPLLLVLVVVEATDVVFAVDSIPAIFAITTDSFVVFTSNIFAILGLRALYFMLAGMMDRFRYLKIGLGLVLTFVGGKMLIHSWIEIPRGLSLAIVGLLIFGSVLVSFLIKRKEGAPPIPAHLHDGQAAPPFAN